MRRVYCKVRPIHPSIALHLQTLQASQSPRPMIRPLLLPRRMILHGLLATTVAPIALAPSSGCDAQQFILTAIELAKAAFKIIEEIRGAFVVNNPSSSMTRLEVATKLVEGLGNVVDEVIHVVDIPGGANMMMADWGDIHAQAAGSHLVRAQEGGNDPVESDQFSVTEP